MTAVVELPTSARASAPPIRGYVVGMVLWLAVTVGAMFFVTSRDVADFVVMSAILAVMAVGFDVAIGTSNQFFFGINACVAVGAYGAGLLALHLTDQPLVGALLAIVCGAAVALFTAVLAVRVRDFYFAILTLAVGLFAERLAVAWQAVTGGATGLAAIPGLGASTIVEPDFRTWIAVSLVSLGLVLFVVLLLLRNKTGRIWRTVARDEPLSAAFGIPVMRYRTYAMGLAGAIAGYGGFLHARYVQFVEPASFSLVLVLTLLVMVYLGGRGSTWGPIVGAFITFGITRFLRSDGEWASFVLAGVLVAVLALAPDGIAGAVRRGARRLTRPTTRGRAR